MRRLIHKSPCYLKVCRRENGIGLSENSFSKETCCCSTNYKPSIFAKYIHTARMTVSWFDTSTTGRPPTLTVYPVRCGNRASMHSHPLHQLHPSALPPSYVPIFEQFRRDSYELPLRQNLLDVVPFTPALIMSMMLTQITCSATCSLQSILFFFRERHTSATGNEHKGAHACSAALSYPLVLPPHGRNHIPILTEMFP